MSRVATDAVLDVHVYYLHDPRLNPTNHSHSFDAYDGLDSENEDDPNSPISDADSLINEMWSCGPSLFVHDDVLTISIMGSMTVKQLKDEVYMSADYWPIHSADCDLLLYHDQRLLYEHQVIGATGWFRKACERMDNVKLQPGEVAPACGIWLLAVPIDSCACPHCSAYQSKRSQRRVKLAQRHIEEHYQNEYMYTTQHVCTDKSGERAPIDEDDSWMDEHPAADKTKNSSKASKAKKSKKKMKANGSSANSTNSKSSADSSSASKSTPSTPIIKARVSQQTFVQPALLTPSIQMLKHPVKPKVTKQSAVDPDFTVVLSKKEKKAKTKLDEDIPSKSRSPYHQPASSANINVTPISNKRKPVTPVFKPVSAMSPKLNSLNGPGPSPKLTSREPPSSAAASKHSRAKPNTPLISASAAPQSARASSTGSSSNSTNSLDSVGSSPHRSSSIDETSEYDRQADRHSTTSSTFSPSSVSSTRSTQSLGDAQGFSLYSSLNGKWSPLIAPVNPMSSGKSSPIIQPMEPSRTFGGVTPFSPILHSSYTPTQRPAAPLGPSSLLSSSVVLNHASSFADDDHCADFSSAMSAADVSKLCDDDDHHVPIPPPVRPQPRFVHPQFSLQRAVPAPSPSFESGASIQKHNYNLYHLQPQVHFSSPYGATQTLLRSAVTTQWQ